MRTLRSELSNAVYMYAQLMEQSWAVRSLDLWRQSTYFFCTVSPLDMHFWRLEQGIGHFRLTVVLLLSFTLLRGTHACAPTRQWCITAATLLAPASACHKHNRLWNGMHMLPVSCRQHASIYAARSHKRNH